MSKSILVLLLSLTSAGLADAASLYVTGAGQFSSSDTAGALVSPNALFSFRFTVESSPTPLPGSITALGFDIPAYSFQYTLNGSAVNAVPSEVRFNTLANGGLFDVIFGSGIKASTFSFQGPQAFTGTTAAPVLPVGTYPVASFTFSDPANFDLQAANVSATVTATPEPSSLQLLLCGMVAVIAAPFRRLLRA